MYFFLHPSNIDPSANTHSKNKYILLPDFLQSPAVFDHPVLTAAAIACARRSLRGCKLLQQGTALANASSADVALTRVAKKKKTGLQHLPPARIRLSPLSLTLSRCVSSLTYRRPRFHHIPALCSSFTMEICNRHVALSELHYRHDSFLAFTLLSFFFASVKSARSNAHAYHRGAVRMQLPV